MKQYLYDNKIKINIKIVYYIYNKKSISENVWKYRNYKKYL